MLRTILKLNLAILSSFGLLLSAVLGDEQLPKPFNNQTQIIPGYIKASHYDAGGEGVAYFDTDSKNLAARNHESFRGGEGVDCTENSVGYISSGEWLNFTVDVEDTQKYDLILHFGRSETYKGPAADISLFVDGTKVTSFNVDKGSGRDWGSIKGRIFATSPVKLSQGKHILRVLFEGGAVNFAGITFRKATSPKGTLLLPKKCVIFAPLVDEKGISDQELLHSIPKEIKTGNVVTYPKKSSFDKNRAIDLAPLIGAKGKKAIGKTAYVYIPFNALKSEATTFGFGADWWYEAYLDGKLISSTMDKGNENWPPAIYNHTVTVDLNTGKHLLVIRFKSGKGSSFLTVGGPEDLRNPYISKLGIKADNGKKIIIPAGECRQGPPIHKKWKLVWNDEFDGQTLNTEKWGEQARSKWNWPGIKTRKGNENTGLDGKGHLILSLTKDKDGTVVYGKSIYSKKFSKAYGYFETRIQFSTQPGWWTAFWISGVPYCTGADNFLNPQEFDIYEDFYKPKSLKDNDIQQTFWSTVDLASGNEFTKSNFDGSAIKVKRIRRFGSHVHPHFEKYEGWHNVGLEWTPLEYIYYVDGIETIRMSYETTPMTTVPLHVIVSAEHRTPGDKHPFYGRLENATFPDLAKFDYVRIYEEDHGNKTAPKVTLELISPKSGEILYETPVKFQVTATDNDGTLKKILLFSKGYLRAEIPVDVSSTKHTFNITTLFEGENTIKAMAQDNDGLVGISSPLTLNVINGKEYTGTAYKGKPQTIPGEILAGHYDEGGQDIAYKMYRNIVRDSRCAWRIKEIGWSTEKAIPCGGSLEPQWVTYQVDVKESGTYKVELFLNRPDNNPPKLKGTDIIQLDIDREKALEWKIPTSWNSGTGWRSPRLPIGEKSIELTAGIHQLILRFNLLKTEYTFFGGLKFTKK